MNRISNSNLYQPSFAPGFLDDHAPRIIKDPKIALVEIVANCWDAGADEVRITWPKDSVPDPIVIEDNGTGMTYEQFVQRWPQLKYNRRSSQGLNVEFPPGNRESHRKAFGRNGKGRHSMFCFANEYWVETWCSGEANLFRVKRASAIALSPYEIAHIKKFAKEGHGTKVSTTLAKKYLPIQDVYDLIGSKFVTDPTFKIYLNEDLVELTNLEHLIDSRIINVPGVGKIKMVLWDLMGLTANMGSGNKMLIPIQVKPQTAKQAINARETIRTSRDRFQFIVDSFDKPTTGSLVKIVGNFVQVVVKGLEKLVKASERRALHFSHPFF